MRHAATVDIGRDLAWLLIIAVFIVTFLVVCAIAYVIFSSKHRAERGTHRISFSSRLPVSKSVFDSIVKTAAAAVSKPEIAPSTRTRLDELAASARPRFERFYRVVMIAIGFVGLTAAIALFRAHTPANMYGLPAGIILLLSLGALLNGLVPGPSIVPDVEPIDPRLLDKIKVQIRRDEPLTVSLSESDVQRASNLLRQGVPIAAAARAIYAHYDELQQSEQRAFESALRQSVKQAGKER